MPEDLPVSGVRLVAETDDYTSEINKVIAQAGQVDTALADVVDAANKTESALNALSGDISVDVDLNLQNRSILGDLNALDDARLTPVIDPTLDDAPVQRVERLDSETVTPKIDAQETTDSKEALDRLDEIRNLQVIEIAMNVGGSLPGVLNTLADVSGVAGLVEMDTTLAKLQARTGAMIPYAERLINDLWSEGWGESRDQVAKVIEQVNNLGIGYGDLEDAARRALEISTIFGEDTQEVLRTMDSLVKNELAQDFNDAADIIVAGFQEGANRGQDLLDTFNEYGTTFKELRISGDAALALINSGLEKGIDNSDRVADSLRELNIRLGQMDDDPAIANAFQQLDDMSKIDLTQLLNAYEAGEISGDTFFEGFFNALSEAQTADAGQAQQLADVLIGTQAEDFGSEAFAGLTTQWNTTMVGIEGRAEQAANAVGNTLGGQFDELFRTVQVSAEDFLSSEQIDLPGKIEAIKTGLKDAIGVLQSGGTLGEALEVGFKIQGVDQFLGGLQSTIGNFTIGLLQMIASIQDFLGKGEAAAGTRQEIARLAEGQLAFDLKVANLEDISAMIATAMDRGLDADTLKASVGAAVDELIREGAVGRAQALVDAVNQQTAQFQLAPDLTFTEDTMARQMLQNFENGLITLDQMRKNAQAEGALVIDVGLDTSDLQAQVDAAAGDLGSQFADALASGDLEKAGALANLLDNDALRDQVDAVKGSFQDMTDSVVTNTENLEDSLLGLGETTALVTTGNTMTEDFLAVAEAAEDAFPRVISAADEVYDAILRWQDLNSILVTVSERFNVFVGSAQAAALAASTAASQIAGALASVGENQGKINEAQTAAEGTKHYAGGGTPPLRESVWVGENGPELAVFDREAAILNQATSRALAQAVSGAAGRPMTTTNSRTQNVTIVNNNTVQSQAQADVIGYRVARDIRGM